MLEQKWLRHSTTNYFFVVSGIFKDVVFKFPPISRPLFSLTVVVLDHYPSQFLGLDYFFLYIFLIYLNFRLYLHLFLFLYLLQISLYLFFSFYCNFLLQYLLYLMHLLLMYISHLFNHLAFILQDDYITHLFYSKHLLRIFIYFSSHFSTKII